MSNLSTLPKGDSAWLLRKAIERIIQQVSVLETNIGASTSGNSANTQIIFNDNGTLRGDAGLVYNKTTDALTVAGLVTAGSATITGDLTVDTSTLVVDSTNNRVGIGTASPTVPLYVTGNNATATAIMQDETNGAKLRLLANSINFDITNGGGGGEIAVSGANPLTFKTNGTERARINSSGNVGIGVTPSAWGAGLKALQFGATGYGAFFDFNNDVIAMSANLFWTGSAYSRISASSKYALAYYQDIGGSHQWLTSSVAGTNAVAPTMNTLMTLDASGNLLVGKTANYGTGETNTLQLKTLLVFGSDNTANAANRNWSIGTNASAAGTMEWTISSTNIGWPNFAYRMQLTSAGAAYNTTGTWGTISDSRLKENVSDARNYLADLLKLRVVKYSLKEEASAVATKLGLIAQEVEQVFPSLVEQSDVAYDGGEGIRTVKTSILVPMLLKAIQELTARVQTLETR